MDEVIVGKYEPEWAWQNLRSVPHHVQLVSHGLSGALYLEFISPEGLKTCIAGLAPSMAEALAKDILRTLALRKKYNKYIDARKEERNG